MRNIFILYIPPGNPEAMVHYQDTITNKVPQERIFPHIKRNLRNQLRKIFKDRPITVWGSRDSSGNRPHYEKMNPGDDILIVEGDNIKLLGKIAAKTKNPQLSEELWQNLKSSTPSVTWSLIYFIANPVEIDLPFDEFKPLFDYQPNWSLRGFTSVSDERLEDFYERYDDLYSILIRLKEGKEIEEKHIPEEKEEQIKAPETDEKEEMDDETISDHLTMQWKLLNLGRKAGSDVWIPKADQTRLTKKFEDIGFEQEFTTGYDVQTKYIDNIDTVWKKEFQIDAAFEIENSTSIYSGLLRFADLKIVAPNSNYPLFVVAPQSRKNRVITQVQRPVFKEIDFDKKVRYLSYESINEIDEFFKQSDKGLDVDVLLSRSEVLD